MPIFDVRNKARAFVDLRREHPGWRLLAARRAPLVLSCLQALFAKADDGVELEAALQALAEVLGEFVNDEQFAVNNDPAIEARRELRKWIQSRLVIERDGRLYATDALESTLMFVAGLGGRLMTSTASRLSVVQREIENLDVGLSEDQTARAEYLRGKIEEFQQELARVEAGDLPVLDADQAIESIREVFNLAAGLRADFRRVEDSYREADKLLREEIISQQRHRGQILDELLNGHERLLNTPEGQVFSGFFEQLRSESLRAKTWQQLRRIVNHPLSSAALNYEQKQAFRYLFPRLNGESETVLRARERSETDVHGFLRSGLIDEHHQVGQLLEAISKVALDLPWSQAALRNSGSCLRPVGFEISHLPLVERLRAKSIAQDDDQALELSQHSANLDEIDDDFWLSFDSLDQQALLDDTRALLAETGEAMSLAQLADALPPTHDLETLTFWLGLAREAQLSVGTEREFVVVTDRDQTDRQWRFDVPKVALSHLALEAIEAEQEAG